MHQRDSSHQIPGNETCRVGQLDLNPFKEIWMTFSGRFATTCWTMVALFAAACSQTGSFSPTSPSAAGGRGVSSTGAVISGTVNGVALSTLSSSDAATTLASLPVTVTVVGTSISTTVDRSGRFELTDVPTGDVQLNFKGTGLDATLTVKGVQTGDLIDITVRLTDNSIRIEAERRQPRGNGDNDDDSDSDGDSDSDSDSDSDDGNVNGDVGGVVSNLTGTCPSLTFSLTGTTGVTFRTGTATRFDSPCASIQNNLSVEVRGRRQANEVQVERIVLRN
jgi:hypothetical protein